MVKEGLQEKYIPEDFLFYSGCILAIEKLIKYKMMILFLF